MTDGPGLFTIPAGVPFVDALAAGILLETADDPLALADYVILLPTRRACRAMRDGFLRVTQGKPLLLPRMRPIGDVEADDLMAGEDTGLESLDLPPAISDQRRMLLLARLILQWDTALTDVARTAMTPDHAVRLARELARLIDQVQTERLSFDALDALVPAEHALHWEDTLEFLRLVTTHWPAILESEGCLDPADRRNRLIETLVRRWSAAPPAGPVIAAGTTGSVPATADLLAVIAELPRGRVVLPGLDTAAEDELWEAVAADPTHPQYGMARLLDRLSVGRDAVREWPAIPAPNGAADRAAVVAEALRPAETTGAWRALPRLRAQALVALPGDGAKTSALRRIVTPGDKEEADVIALLLRHNLETPGRTAALVTPDRRLARRVAASLRRWGIDIDDSAGRPLGESPPGVFFRAVAEAACESLSPVAFLAACKHPLAAAGLAPVAFRRCIRHLETALLRGPKPAPGIDGLRLTLQESRQESDAELTDLIDTLAGCFGPLIDAVSQREIGFADLLRAHVVAAEALARSDSENGAARLWDGEAGEALAAFVNDLHHAANALPAVSPFAYPDMLEALMAGQVVRPRFGRHARLHIWGPLEARLQHADLIVLGGLNEGVWPADPAPDPWMSRPMRERFGLPLPERRIGLAAHDFAQLVCAPEVVLTRAEKSDGTPTVPSRWLLRLETVLQGCGLAEEFASDTAWLGLQRGLAAVDAHRPMAAPAPTPPVDARPRRLSVTRVETWIRDPYGIYARHVLGLRPLDPLEADPGAADRGTIIHQALDDFQRAHPDALPEDALARLLALGRAAFGATLARPAVRAFWWPRFERIAVWFVKQEAARRAAVAATATEVTGRIDVAGPAGPFTLTATADRIDRFANGGLALVDYKTGAAPSDKQVWAGYAPQLPLEAVIAGQGGFEGVAPGPVEELAHWRLTGGSTPAEVRRIDGDLDELAAKAQAILLGLVRAFDDPEMPYHVVPYPDPARRPRFNDYEHLERMREWAAGEGDGA